LIKLATIDKIPNIISNPKNANERMFLNDETSSPKFLSLM